MNKLKFLFQVSCGDSHVVALSDALEVFTWGCGEHGRLGHGDEDDVFEPKKLHLKLKIRSVVAGPDCTFLITTKGRVLAFGSNDNNKLGLNSKAFGVKCSNTKKQLQVNFIFQDKEFL